MRVLLVEDESAEARLVQLVLSEPEGERCELEQVRTLQEAVTCLANGRFDVVLLDLTLPDSHGVSSVEKLRRASPSTPIVVLTGNEDPALSETAIALGARGFYHKSDVDIRVLGRALRRAIEQQQSELATRVP